MVGGSIHRVGELEKLQRGHVVSHVDGRANSPRKTGEYALQRGHVVSHVDGSVCSGSGRTSSVRFNAAPWFPTWMAAALVTDGSDPTKLQRGHVVSHVDGSSFMSCTSINQERFNAATWFPTWMAAAAEDKPEKQSGL